MSNCPNCGAMTMTRGWLCGTQDPDCPSEKCMDNVLRNDLAQANAVIDAINTLLENGGDVGILVLSSDDGISVTARVHGKDSSCHAHDVTLREALEACVAARDQHDKERKET